MCAMKSKATDQFYNVGTGKRTSLENLPEMLVDLTDTDKPIKYGEKFSDTCKK